MVAAWITPDELADPSSAFAEDAVDAASFVLFHLSGRKYGGVRTTTEVYCQVGLNQIGLSSYYGPRGYPPLPGPSGYAVMYPELVNGEVINRIGGLCNSCGCAHLIRLRGAPILSVEMVHRGDQEIPLSEVMIYDSSYITAGNGRCWQTCDDLEVTYTYGAPPPALGKIAARALADQYVLAMDGSDDCTLPQRITQISRQGESWTLLDPQTFLEKGRTGIYQVDLFLTTVNPDGARLRSRVFSPDTLRGKTARKAEPTVALMRAATPSLMSFGTVEPGTTSTAPVTVYARQPLRWAVPGSFTPESPPTILVRPSGQSVPPDSLKWRTGNFTLDLTSDEVERLLPPGSVMVVATTGPDGTTMAEASYPVERRSL